MAGSALEMIDMNGYAPIIEFRTVLRMILNASVLMLLILACADISSATNAVSGQGAHPLDINVTFGKLIVHSEGVNGKLLDSSVCVYNQSTGDVVTSGSTGSDGVISFYLAPGTYKARISESNHIWGEDLVITAGNETSTTAVFGGLNVHSRDFDENPLNSFVRVYSQSTGDSVDSGNTGSDGVISFYLAPGTYKAMVEKSTDVWYYDIVVTAGNVTNVGDYINHNPIIHSITANPERINPGSSTNITVSASDVDGDVLSYSYFVSVGNIVGAGSTAQYTAPTTSDTYRIDVVVSDGNGGTAQGCIFVSDRYGDLVVNSRGVDGASLDSYVHVYKQSTGASVESFYYLLVTGQIHQSRLFGAT